MTNELFALATRIIAAGERGAPMPPIPASVDPKAAQYGYELGQMWAEIEKRKQ